MHRWRVGEVEITRIESFDIELPSEVEMPEWAVPSLAPSTGEYRVADSVIAIRDGDTRIVVDPWFLTDRDQPDIADTSNRLLGELADAGFPAERVDFVVNSHLEGVGLNTILVDGRWQLAFPHAEYLYPAEDLDAVDRGEPIPGADDLAHLRSLTEVVAVGERFELTDSVSILRTLGHGFGHQVVRVRSGDDTAVYLGHLVIHPAQFADPELLLDGDPDGPATLRRQLSQLAEAGGLALTTLVGGPGGGRVASDGDGFRITPAEL